MKKILAKIKNKEKFSPSIYIRQKNNKKLFSIFKHKNILSKSYIELLVYISLISIFFIIKNLVILPTFVILANF